MRFIRYKTPQYVPATHPSLLDEMDRLFDAAFPALTAIQRGNTADVPVDLFHGRDAYTVRAELPGFRKEDVSLDLTDGILTLTATQKTEAKAEGTEQPAPTQERRVRRAVNLPDNVDVEKIAAAYENGVLTITLPKREEVKPRQIAIDVK